MTVLFILTVHNDCGEALVYANNGTNIVSLFGTEEKAFNGWGLAGDERGAEEREESGCLHYVESCYTQ